MVKISSLFLKFVGFLILFYIGLSVVKRTIWFWEALTINSITDGNLHELQNDACKKAYMININPDMCKVAHETLNKPTVLRAFSHVLNRTESCIDIPCSHILYNLLNTWIGWFVLSITIIFSMSALYSLSEGRNKFSYSRPNEGLQFIPIPVTNYIDGSNNARLIQRNSRVFEEQ